MAEHSDIDFIAVLTIPKAICPYRHLSDVIVMPRPTAILPKYIIGGVEDYAKRLDISKDDAHAALLLRGLRDAGQEGFITIENELNKIEDQNHDQSDGEN